MRLHGRYNIGVPFFICLTFSLLLPVSAACNKKGPDANLRINRVAGLSSEDGLCSIHRDLDSACLKKTAKAAHPRFGRARCRRIMIPEENWTTKIISFNNTEKVAEYDFSLYTRRSWNIFPVPVCPQLFLPAFPGRSPPAQHFYAESVSSDWEVSCKREEFPVAGNLFLNAKNAFGNL